MSGGRAALIVVVLMLASLTSVLAGDPSDAAVQARRRGDEKLDQGDHAGAISDYTKAIETDPRYAVAYQHRAIARRAIRDLDGAITDSSKAISIDPKYQEAYYTRGVARRAKGDLGRGRGSHEGHSAQARRLGRLRQPRRGEA